MPGHDLARGGSNRPYDWNVCHQLVCDAALLLLSPLLGASNGDGLPPQPRVLPCTTRNNPGLGAYATPQPPPGQRPHWEVELPPVAVEGEVSPRTQGLALFIQEAVAQLRTSSRENNAASTDGLLFLGNWHDSHPRLLFHDPVLEPVRRMDRSPRCLDANSGAANCRSAWKPRSKSRSSFSSQLSSVSMSIGDDMPFSTSHRM